MTPRPLSPHDYRALAEFRYRLRSFLEFSEKAARDAGLDPGKHQLLLAVKGLPEIERPTIRTLARRLGLRHHSAVELVDRAARQGLVARTTSARDHREVLVKITPRGGQMLARLSQRHREELIAIRPRLFAALEALVSDIAPPAAAGDR